MGTQHTTVYWCDTCGVESTNLNSRVDSSIWLRNRHGGSPRIEWKVCDSCDLALAKAMQVVLDDLYKLGAEVGNKRHRNIKMFDTRGRMSI